MEKVTMEKNTVKMEVLIVLLISISAILLAIIFSPDFIAGNFSSDGNLHPTTIIKINNMRMGVSIIGFLGILSSLVLLLNKGALYNSVAGTLDSLFAKIFDRVNAAFYPAMILLLLAVFAGYIFIASHSFFTNDDYREVMRAMFEPFRFPLPASGQPHYRPIPREIFFFISYQLFGLKPFGYFFLNIVTHTASGVCLFFILRKLELTRKLSLVVSFIYFANLPALLKMSWISNIGHTSYHLFLAFSALFALSSVETSGMRKTGFIFLSIISYMLSLLSNQAGMFFPIILILLLYIKINHEKYVHKRNENISYVIKFATIYSAIFLAYVVFIFLPTLKPQVITEPYYLDVSIQTFLDNIRYYTIVFLPNSKDRLMLIPLIIALPLVLLQKEVKLYFQKSTLLKLIAIFFISGFLYAPFAFLKWQKYPNYVSLVLIPLYVLILYPFFKGLKDKSDCLFGANFRRAGNIFILAWIVLLSLPSLNDLKYHFSNSPRLHMSSVWRQAHSLMPEIPEGVTKVIFIVNESFKPHKYVSYWQKTPPFWHSTGHGRMFNVLYRRRDINFELYTDAPVVPEHDAIYFTVKKESIGNGWRYDLTPLSFAKGH